MPAHTAPTVVTPQQHQPPVRTPRAVLFDAYGTLFDVYSIAQLAEQLFPGQGQAISVLWRDKQIEYTRLVTTSSHGAHYQPFSALTRAALVFAIKKVAACARIHWTKDEFDAQHGDSVAQLMAQYQQLGAFDDSAPVLQALHARGIVTGTLSNGDLPMLQAAVSSAQLEHLLDHVISVDSIRRYKTDPAAYALGEQATGLAAADIVFVSANAWDALAATWYGYQTLWINRHNTPFEELGTQPTRVGSGLLDVLEFFHV